MTKIKKVGKETMERVGNQEVYLNVDPVLPADAMNVILDADIIIDAEVEGQTEPVRMLIQGVCTASKNGRFVYYENLDMADTVQGNLQRRIAKQNHMVIADRLKHEREVDFIQGENDATPKV